MKRLKILILVVALSAFYMVGCTKDDGEAPTISTMVCVVGQEGNPSALMVAAGTDVVYKFSIKSATEIKKIELWAHEGIGINSQAAKKAKEWIAPATTIGNEWVIQDTVFGLDVDMQYSVYVQGMDTKYSSAKVNCFLDVMRYSQSLTDGAPSGISKTFMNVESGRSFYIANTIGDPKGMDLGFTYMENTPNKACLVAFDEYYKTGNYAMVINDLNPTMTFRNATALMVEDDFEDEITVASQLQTYYDRAKAYPAVLNFTQDKIASNLDEDDVVAFLTGYGRYGLLKVSSIDRKDEAVANSQVIKFDVVVTKKR